MNTNMTRRIGLLLPSANIVMDVDFYRHLPENIFVHSTRMHLPETTVECEEEMLDKHVLPAALNIENVKPDVVVFGCTSAGALRGKAYEEKLVAEISSITQTPVVSVMQAVKDVLSDAGIKRIVVVTPYVEPVDRRLAASFREDGFEVVHIQGMGIAQSKDLGRVPTDEIVAFTHRAVAGLRPDGVFIACTNFPAMSALPRLEQELPFPVITSNQATYQKALSVLQSIS